MTTAPHDPRARRSHGRHLAFTAHDGDLKAGKGPCPDSLYTDAKARLNSLEAPAMFTPGDNDWTDCDRTPGVNSSERLAFERTILFDTSFSLGQRPLRQKVQAAPYVENRRWTVGRVAYATLNVQGPGNQSRGMESAGGAGGGVETHERTLTSRGPEASPERRRAPYRAPFGSRVCLSALRRFRPTLDARGGAASPERRPDVVPSASPRVDERM